MTPFTWNAQKRQIHESERAAVARGGVSDYGRDPEYQAYVRSVPILLPFVPLYSVEKYKWLVA